jgi:hypothetical protein
LRIADTVPEFIAAVEASLRLDRASLLPLADAMLVGQCWDRTFAEMKQVVDAGLFMFDRRVERRAHA